MKKLLVVLFSLFSVSLLLAQSTDKPLHNFYANTDIKSLEYRYVVESPQDSIKQLKQKLKMLLTSSQSFSEITYDENSCTGNISKIFPSYYSNSKELKGSFKIDIKNGKYRITITGMTLNGSVFNDDLANVVLSNNYAKWTQMADNLLPDLNGVFIKLFSIASADSSSW